MSRTTADLRLTSPAFESGATISRQYTADGQNQSPPLHWGDVPAEAKSLALICEDPDAPRGLFTHWLIFNMPTNLRDLPEGVSNAPTLPDGSVQGTNDFSKIGYGGPSPPPGRPHRYFFKLYALSERLDLGTGASREKLLAAMSDVIVGEGELVGTYGRPAK